MTVLLFIDPGTHCGIAYGADNVRPRYGEWDLSRSKHESWGMTPIKLKRHLEELHRAVEFNHVGYEEVRRHVGTDAAHMYGALVAAIQEFCLNRGIEFESVGVGVLKRFWTGKGNATKREMMAAAQSRGFEPNSDNEADALAGWHWLQAKIGSDLKQVVELKSKAEDKLLFGVAGETK